MSTIMDRSISEAEDVVKALKTLKKEMRLDTIPDRYLFGDPELSFEAERMIEKEFRKKRRAVKRICLKYKILLFLTVQWAKLKSWLRG